MRPLGFIQTVERGYLMMLTALVAALLIVFLWRQPVAFFAPQGWPASLLIGLILMALNFAVVSRLLKRFFQPQRQSLVILLLPFKTLLLGLAVYLLFHYLGVRPSGLVAGMLLGLLVPTAVALWLVAKRRPLDP